MNKDQTEEKDTTENGDEIAMTSKDIASKADEVNAKENDMSNGENTVGDDQVVQNPEIVNAVEMKGGEEQANPESLVVTQVVGQLTVNPDVLSGSDGQALKAIVEAATLNTGMPNDMELESYGNAVKDVLSDINLVVSTAGSFTVERYYYIGSLLNAMAKRMPKKELNAWLRSLTVRNGQLEMFRQMRKIARMGQEALDRAILGKNRVLELYYMVREMEEPDKKTELSAQMVRAQLQKLESDHPFPSHAALDQDDIDECRIHMDAIVTMYRIGAAFDDCEICTFENARDFAAAKGRSMEKGEAKRLAKKLGGEDDKPAALNGWFADGMKMPHSAGAGDPARFAERVSNLKDDVDEIVASDELIQQLRNNGVFVDAVKEAYEFITDLWGRVGTTEDGIPDEEVVG